MMEWSLFSAFAAACDVNMGVQFLPYFPSGLFCIACQFFFSFLFDDSLFLSCHHCQYPITDRFAPLIFESPFL